MQKFNKLPTHLLRDDCLETIIKKWEPGRFLEIGPGCGLTTSLFLRNRFFGSCFEASADSRLILEENLKIYKEQIELLESIEQLLPQSFDYLFSFDVIEHIPDDKDALEKWTSLLRPGGKLLLSVPADEKKFGISDKLMGHVRRYGKKQLYALIEEAGYENITILSYGFPLVNITLSSINFLYKVFLPNKEYNNLSLEEKTAKSGVKNPGLVRRLAFIFNRGTVFPFILLQRVFLKYDLGAAYIAFATKKY